MRQHPPAGLAWVLAGLSSTGVVAAIAAAWIWPEITTAQFATTPVVHTIEALGLAGAVVVGTLIAWRRPDHRYGWLLLSLGLTGAVLGLTGVYGTLALIVHPGALPFGWAAAMLATVLWLLVFVHIPFLLLLFPDGRLPSPRWRWLPRTVIGLSALALVAASLMPGPLGVVPVDNPLGVGGTLGAVAEWTAILAVFGLFGASFAAGVSVFARRRRAGPQERLQLRWFAWAAGLFGAILAGTGGGAFVPAGPLANAVVGTVTLSAVFAAIGVAVLRYRLYEIDRIISRTVGYALLSGVLVAVYVIAVLVLSRLLAPLGAGSELAVAAATLTAAALFTPARRTIQNVVDRRFNRARYDAERTLAAFRGSLREAVPLHTVTTELGSAVGRALAPAAVSLWLSDGSTTHRLAAGAASRSLAGSRTRPDAPHQPGGLR